MTRRTYYKRMFYAAAIFNWLASASVIAKMSFPSMVPIDSPFDPLGGHAFAVLVAVFGYGYFLLGRDPAQNEGIVWMGIVGKLLMFALFLAHAIGGTFPFVLLIPVFGDVIFAFLFLEFLLAGRPRYATA
jgi:hypothetical protein